MQSVCLAALVVALTLSTPAGAQVASVVANENSAGGLAESCRDPIESKDAFGSGFCLGFIRGSRDMARVLDQVTPDEHRPRIPEGVTTGQLAKVLVRWADNHPEQLHVPAVVGVHRSTIAALPCKSTAKP